jgi:ribosomal protein L32
MPEDPLGRVLHEYCSGQLAQVPLDIASWCLILGIFTGFIAYHKGYSFLKWFLIGAIFPVIGLIIAAYNLPELEKCLNCGKLSTSDHAICPYCHELKDWKRQAPSSQVQSRMLYPTQSQQVPLQDRTTSVVSSYIGNSRTMKFHHPHCPWVQRISPQNRVYFKTSKEAISQGYVPCRCITTLEQE